MNDERETMNEKRETTKDEVIARSLSFVISVFLLIVHRSAFSVFFNSLRGRATPGRDAPP